jgi:hypothetical protein
LATLAIGAECEAGVAAITLPLAVPIAAWAPLGHGIGPLEVPTVDDEPIVCAACTSLTGRNSLMARRTRTTAAASISFRDRRMFTSRNLDRKGLRQPGPLRAELAGLGRDTLHEHHVRLRRFEGQAFVLLVLRAVIPGSGLLHRRKLENYDAAWAPPVLGWVPAVAEDPGA